MTRRIVWAWVGLVLAAGTAAAQTPFPDRLLPQRPSLAKIGLERHWFNVVPLYGNETVLELSIDDNLVFAQTTSGNFHAYDSESGRRVFSSTLGRRLVDAKPASANASGVFVTALNLLYALDRTNGKPLWTKQLLEIPAGPVSASEDHVYVGLTSGSLISFNAKTGKEEWNVKTRSEVSSRPHPAGRIVAFASHDGKVYSSRVEFLQILWRWASGGPIVAPLGAQGVRTLLVPSMDKNLYAVDLFTGETKWAFPTGAPIDQEPLVAGDDVLVANTGGQLHSVNATSGAANWSIETLGGQLLGVTPKRVYLETGDGDLFIVDRLTGKMLFDARSTHERAGVNLRGFNLGPTNRLNDRMYVGSKSGLVVCLREVNDIKPVPLRDPNQKPFGYIPPEGYPDAPVIPSAPAPKAEADENAAPAPGTGAKPE